jgi:hypothetical protein
VREPLFILDEREMLEAWLEFHRTTLRELVDGQVGWRPQPVCLSERR